jgi:hypothetical protein
MSGCTAAIFCGSASSEGSGDCGDGGDKRGVKLLKFELFQLRQRLFIIIYFGYEVI